MIFIFMNLTFFYVFIWRITRIFDINISNIYIWILKEGVILTKKKKVFLLK